MVVVEVNDSSAEVNRNHEFVQTSRGAVLAPVVVAMVYHHGFEMVEEVYVMLGLL